ncbi:Fur family transcriptional regulator [Fundicoccus sp. Sow4_D5]|uniref:Fur family transcriptional regulator n=1 Tax=unclassified Fundicoccus TaxID=2761543 RepID=UPI003F9330E0
MKEKSKQISQTSELVTAGIKQLKAAGFKLTKKRQEIIELFAQTQRYLSATHIHQEMSERYPTMSYNTTYRNIYDFVEIGLLESTEYNQEQLFRFDCYLLNEKKVENHHHHHFICRECGLTLLLDACPMQQVTTDLTGVVIESHRFEVFGLCRECASKLSANHAVP